MEQERWWYLSFGEVMMVGPIETALVEEHTDADQRECLLSKAELTYEATP